MTKKRNRYLFGLFKICILALCLYGLKQFVHRATDGFTLTKISSNLSYHPQWDVVETEADHKKLLSQILNQKFHYLSKGAQCYAFASEDGQYVLKFFRFQHLLPSPFLTHLPCPNFLKRWRDAKIAKRESELVRDFSSYKLAFDELKTECGLISIHLNKTSHLFRPLTIVDKLNIEHCVDLDKTEFILQRKAKLVYPQIKEWMEQGDVIAAKRAIKELLQLVALKGEKGIVDIDPNLSKNFGFIDGKPIQIDVGRFERRKPSEEPVFQKVLKRMHDDFIHWLNKNYPLLSEHFEEEFNKQLKTF